MKKHFKFGVRLDVDRNFTFGRGHTPTEDGTLSTEGQALAARRERIDRKRSAMKKKERDFR